MTTFEQSGELADGTKWSMFYPRPGGQRAGTPAMRVSLTMEYVEKPLVLVCGRRSQHKTREAIKSCYTWTQVPMAVEATRWEV